MAVLVGVVLAFGALSACGGDGDDRQASQAGATQGSEVRTGPTASGTTGATSPSGAKRPAADAEQQRETPPRAETRDAGVESKPRAADDSKGTKLEKDGDKRKEDEGKPKSAWSTISARKLQHDSRIVCRIMGLQQVAVEYAAKSQTPADAAEAYADAFVGGGAPEWTRKPVYEGCLAGLTGH